MRPALRVQQALSRNAISVRERECLRDLAARRTITAVAAFAVFSESGSFQGAITAREAALFPERSFADLLTKRPLPPLQADAPLEDAVLLFNTEQVECLGVYDRHNQFCGILSQASALEALIAREHHLTFYDQLTALPNRAFLHTRLDQLIQASRRDGSPFAVAFIDLDNFKQINNALGHCMGDQVLADVGQRLAANRRQQDTVCRFGGDAFVAILSGYGSEAELRTRVDHLFSCLNGHVTVREHEVFITASIGVARYPRDGVDGEHLLRNADLAMYRSKEGGRERFHFYEPGMDIESARQLKLQNILRRAYENGNFWLAWQPQFCLHSGDMVGAEVLMRCTSPASGSIDPSTFIPVAEQSGLIISLGEWALQQVARETVTHLAGLPAGFRIAVNLSVSQLDNALIQPVLETAKAVQSRGFRLEVEITESTLMKASGEGDRFIAELAAHAVEIAVDDFGSGYSNLARLRDMPVNRLKIAPGFTHELDAIGNRSAKIAAAVIALSRALSIAVTAEGVERPEQAELLRRLGCDDAQGYWYARPMPITEFAALAHRAAAIASCRQARKQPQTARSLTTPQGKRMRYRARARQPSRNRNGRQPILDRRFQSTGQRIKGRLSQIASRDPPDRPGLRMPRGDILLA